MADVDPPTEPVPAPAAEAPAATSEPAPASAAVTASAPVTAPPAPRGRVFVRRPAPFILIGLVGLLLGCLIGGIGGLFVGHVTAGHGHRHGHGRPGYGPQQVYPQQPQLRRDRPGGQFPLPPRRQNQPSPAAPAPSAS